MPRARYIPELLQVHAEELAFLWGQRKRALHSFELTQRNYADLAERVEAHAQGLLCAPAPDLLDLLSPALNGVDGEDCDEVFAAAYALLRSQQPAAERAVLKSFASAHGPALQGLLEALATAPATAALDGLHSLLAQAPAATAAAAAAVLASHRQLPGNATRLPQLLVDPDPATANWAWRAATLADRSRNADTPQRPYAAALGHADATVRDAGWAAVAWAGHGASLPALRKAAAEGDAVALRWLAVLGCNEDLPLVQRGTLALDDGPARCALLARHGHPTGLNALVRWMDEGDEGTQVAAGEAFELLTGIDVRGERRQVTPPDGADDFAREMAPLAWFPATDKAHAALQQHGSTWAGGQRWRRGLCLDNAPTAEQARTLDMQSRWDIAARVALAGGAAPPPPLV
jgi:uncharacterized protein (TIGR02270 family)